jgi:hypothetical protein
MMIYLFFVEKLYLHGTVNCDFVDFILFIWIGSLCKLNLRFICKLRKGAYRDDSGKPVVLECVREAERRIAGNQFM